VAVVGGQGITREEFETELRRVRAETGDLVLQREVMQGLKASVLNQIIERQLVLDEAPQYGVTVTDGEVDARVRRIRGDYPEDGFEKTARENFVNLTVWRQRVREGLLMEKVAQEAVGKALDPDEEEMLRYYRAHAGEYSLGDRIHLRQIVVHTREEAEALRARVLRGEPFTEVARKHSLTPDAEQGGDVGVFASGEMPVEFNQAFGLKVNEVSPVVQSSYGFHLFMVLEKLPGRIPPFDEVRLKVRDRMMQERKEKAYQAWLKMLRDRAGVRVYQEEIDTIN
jgi:parvulin-like peptidyl-prolyl isomerase